MVKIISKCCKAEVETEELKGKYSHEQYYVCSKCKKKCDISYD